MSRIKLQLPSSFIFSTEIPVRISDINYGNHLSNDSFFTLMHETRMQFFKHFGYTEMNMAGVSLIMGDAAIVFKKECFYGDVLIIEITAAEFGSRNFDLYYRFTKKETNELACEAKTGMVCYDYKQLKTVEVPDVFKQLFS